MGSAARPQHRPQAWRVCPKAYPVPGPLSIAVPGGTRARGVPTWGTGVDQPHLGWLWAPDELGPVSESEGASAGRMRRLALAGGEGRLELGVGAMGAGEVKFGGWGVPA